MNNLLIIFGSACIAVIFVEQRMYMPVKRMIRSDMSKRVKPLDCALCLAWWLGIISSIYFEKNTLEVIYIGAGAAISAVAITKHLQK
ncbi:hypothetical protein [Chitinophaga sp. sic0106]|uniref:hypothetical protein n=1 Tax=Chitinophaga sp. sic0106 TaxID=2854785 RepID=UPI001C44E8D9|nr:hypothetical protein [Chitinophaga sp. sic0106]MBV7534066.1 hypothetical protein [Chitinophaga sp. sic0106]